VGFDRETANFLDSQLGFIKFMVIPLYEAMAKLVPIPRLLQNLRAVVDDYQAQLAVAAAAGAQ